MAFSDYKTVAQVQNDKFFIVKQKGSRFELN